MRGLLAIPMLRSCVAIGALGAAGASASYVVDPELEVKGAIEQLRTGQAACRASAASQLGDYPELATQSRPALEEALGDPQPSVRVAAAYAIGELGQKGASPGVVRRLGRLLRDRSEDVRTAAAFALGDIGQAPQGGLPLLRRQFRASSGAHQLGAALALVRLYPAESAGLVDRRRMAQRAVDLTMQRLDAREADDFRKIRLFARATVRLSRELAADTVDRLTTQAIAEAEGRSEGQARYVILLYGPELGTFESRWLQRLAHGDAQSRARAARVLGFLGVPSPPVVGGLARALESEPVVSIAAMRALRLLGEAARPRVGKRLLLFARGKDPVRRKEAVMALEEVWPEQVERLAREMKARDPGFAKWLEERVLYMRLRAL